MSNIQYQSTIAEPLVFRGVGVHSGHVSELRVLPAEAESGVVFERGDLEGKAGFEATAGHILSTTLCTTVGLDSEYKISTVEHLLAAVSGAGIDNLRVIASGPEIPVLDGSSREFYAAFQKSRIEQNPHKRKYYKLKENIEVSMGQSILRAISSDRLRIHCVIDFDSARIGRQELVFGESGDPFAEVAFARTFCTLGEFEKLKAAGLGKGGSLDNAVVVDGDHVLNDGGLRSEDEFVRHKVLDAVGDFYLLGAPLLADVFMERPGHALNALFTKTLLENKERYLEECYF